MVGQTVLALAGIVAMLGVVLGIWYGVNSIILIAMRALPLVGKRRR